MGSQVSHITVNVPRDITTATAGDIAVTAAEGGIGYWAVIDRYDWKSWFTESSDFNEPRDVLTDYVFYTIVDLEEGDLDDLRDDCVRRDIEMDLKVTPTLIARGIERFLQGQGNVNRRVFADMEDFAAMDSDEADIVIQLGAFGTLVFG